jgi:hypothetical protein
MAVKMGDLLANHVAFYRVEVPGEPPVNSNHRITEESRITRDCTDVRRGSFNAIRVIRVIRATRG